MDPCSLAYARREQLRSLLRGNEDWVCVEWVDEGCSDDTAHDFITRREPNIAVYGCYYWAGGGFLVRGSDSYGDALYSRVDGHWAWRYYEHLIECVIRFSSDPLV